MTTLKTTQIITKQYKTMKVMKFGGTSVGSAARMKGVVNLIADGETKVVVLSAMSGTTNSLIEFTNYLRNGNSTGAIEHITNLQSKYKQTIKDLYTSEAYAEKANIKITEIFNLLRTLALCHYHIFVVRSERL